MLRHAVTTRKAIGHEIDQWSDLRSILEAVSEDNFTADYFELDGGEVFFFGGFAAQTY